jgi:hypothetical protein
MPFSGGNSTTPNVDNEGSALSSRLSRRTAGSKPASAEPAGLEIGTDVGLSGAMAASGTVCEYSGALKAPSRAATPRWISRNDMVSTQRLGTACIPPSGLSGTEQHHGRRRAWRRSGGRRGELGAASGRPTSASVRSVMPRGQATASRAPRACLARIGGCSDGGRSACHAALGPSEPRVARGPAPCRRRPWPGGSGRGR